MISFEVRGAGPAERIIAEMCAMFGWLSAADAFASRTKRRMPSWFASKVSGENFQNNFAIQLCVLRQIHLTIPPAPIFETMR